MPIAGLLPPDNTTLQALHVPCSILDDQYGGASSTSRRVRVLWDNLPASMATWEDLDELRRHFPAAPAWGQAGSQGGENVMVGPMVSDPDQPGTELAKKGPSQEE